MRPDKLYRHLYSHTGFCVPFPGHKSALWDTLCSFCCPNPPIRRFQPNLPTWGGCLLFLLPPAAETMSCTSFTRITMENMKNGLLSQWVAKNEISLNLQNWKLHFYNKIHLRITNLLKFNLVESKMNSQIWAVAALPSTEPASSNLTSCGRKCFRRVFQN